jgi:hypothetical protein
MRIPPDPFSIIVQELPLGTRGFGAELLDPLAHCGVIGVRPLSDLQAGLSPQGSTRRSIAIMSSSTWR